MSFCLDVEGAPGRLIDGTPLVDLMPDLEGARHIGVNCVPASSLIDHLKTIQEAAPEGATLAAYGNVGIPDDVRGWINTDAVDPDRYAALAADWSSAGAVLVGGCCGTTPGTIRAISRLRDRISGSTGE